MSYEDNEKRAAILKVVSAADTDGFNQQCEQAIKESLNVYGRLHITSTSDGRVVYSIGFIKREYRQT